MVIEDSTFTAPSATSTTYGLSASLIWISVSFDDIFSNGNVNRFTITSSSFFGAFEMLRIEGSPDCEVVLDDVNVTYSQNLADDLQTYTEWNDNSVITINSENAVISMNDVIVTAEIQCSADHILKGDYLDCPVLPYCNSPTPFLINQVSIYQNVFSSNCSKILDKSSRF